MDFPESGRRLTIGRYCSIAGRVEILLGGDHRLDWVSTYPFAAMSGLWPNADASQDYHASRGDVTIGHDLRRGSACLILSGVTVGHDAAAALVEAAWWDFPHATVTRWVPLLQIGRVGELIAVVRAERAVATPPRLP